MLYLQLSLSKPSESLELIQVLKGHAPNRVLPVIYDITRGSWIRAQLKDRACLAKTPAADILRGFVTAANYLAWARFMFIRTAGCDFPYVTHGDIQMGDNVHVIYGLTARLVLRTNSGFTRIVGLTERDFQDKDFSLTEAGPGKRSFRRRDDRDISLCGQELRIS